MNPDIDRESRCTFVEGEVESRLRSAAALARGVSLEDAPAGRTLWLETILGTPESMPPKSRGDSRVLEGGERINSGLHDRANCTPQRGVLVARELPVGIKSPPSEVGEIENPWQGARS